MVNKNFSISALNPSSSVDNLILEIIFCFFMNASKFQKFKVSLVQKQCKNNQTIALGQECFRIKSRIKTGLNLSVEGNKNLEELNFRFV